MDILFLRYGNFIDNIMKDWWKVDCEKKAYKAWEFRQNIGVNNNSEVHIFMKGCFFTSSSNLESKYWRFQNMWDLKIDLGIIFWDILPLNNYCNSILSLPPSGRYVESHSQFQHKKYKEWNDGNEMNANGLLKPSPLKVKIT